MKPMTPAINSTHTRPASVLYRLVRPLLFSLDAERAHDVSLRALRILQAMPGGLSLLRATHSFTSPRLQTRICGIPLLNPLGVAAGLDKNARVIDGLLALGFGFVEVGTVTPRPQPGNARPRLFRIPPAGAVINRFGFNNCGVDDMARRLMQRSPRPADPSIQTPFPVLGINIGKNKDTKEGESAADYIAALRGLQQYGDYLAVNVSSPNTPGLRDLQEPERLAGLLRDLVTANRAAARTIDHKPRPIFVKLAPDMTDDLLRQILDHAAQAGVDGMILTNTTVARDHLPDCKAAAEAGGLSGPPLFERSRHMVAVAHRHLNGRLPILGVGGVRNSDEAFEMLAAGASAVQLYTGFVYGGPALPGMILRGLDQRLAKEGVKTVCEIIGSNARTEAARPQPHLDAAISGRIHVGVTLLTVSLAGVLLWLFLSWFHAPASTSTQEVDPPREGLTILPLNDPGPPEQRFVARTPAETGIAFSNFLRRENTLPYIYNGAGCAVGDYDGNGLPDIYLVSQDGPNKLFKQVAPWKFVDVTEEAGVAGGEAWGTGAVFVDVDGDGRLDLYVCNLEAPNLLYIQQADGTFKERAKDFGLDHVGASMMAAFADYDRDGDLDVYLLTNRVFSPSIPQTLLDEVVLPRDTQKTVAQMNPAPIEPRMVDGKWTVPEGLEDHLTILHGRPFFTGQKDRLLRNDGSKFVDVSEAAGITHHGMGLGVVWFDMDGDGWPDIYVANDLESPDRLYRNRGDGTFEELSESALPHLAYFGMGVDAADINNDGRMDVLVADMASTTHFKSKWLMGEMSNRGWFLEHARPQQYMRNALFLNTGTNRFKEIAFLAGVASTDWTWAVKFNDLDNDGFVDLFVTNGIPRFDMDPDLNPRFAQLLRAGRTTEAYDLARNVPPFPEANIALRNTGSLKFENVSKAWGLDLVGVSHGACAVDLDRDGDLDLIVNNQNAAVSIYENRINKANAVLIRLMGRDANTFGLDAVVEVRAGTMTQTRHLTPTRGYLSGDESILHVAVGAATRIDQLTVHWPSGRTQEFKDLPVRRKFIVHEPDTQPGAKDRREPAPTPGFVRIETEVGLEFLHQERPFDDYQRQPLLPHRLSRLGPGIAVGDVTGNGMDDIFVGGAAGQSGRLFLRTEGGRYRAIDDPFKADAASEDMGVLFFDMDLDGDLDLYVVSGSIECAEGAEVLRDRLYRNDGDGRFTKVEDALPDLRFSGSCVVAADFDGDGDLDLFVGSRTVPGRFPHAPRSLLLRNEGGRFVDAPDLAPALAELGMVSAACWTDLNDDGRPDLVVAVHFGPIVALLNEGGRLVDATARFGLSEATGWWNGLAVGDLDQDGDLDLVVSNFGLNTKYKASPDHPAQIFADDIDGDGNLDVVEAKFQGDDLLPVRGRSCSSQAMPFIAEKYRTYQKFAAATLEEIYTKAKLDLALQLSANTLETTWLRRDGDRFTAVPMPFLAQAAPGFGLVIHDVDGDGRNDVLMAQNFFSPEPETGRMAGGLGAWLRNTENGFELVPARVSGLVLPYDGKGLALCDVNGNGQLDLLYAQSNGPLLALSYQGPAVERLQLRLRGTPGNPTGVGARITVEGSSGRQVAEVHAGSGYLSQSSATLSFAGRFSKATVRWPHGATTEHEIPDGQTALELVDPRRN